MTQNNIVSCFAWYDTLVWVMKSDSPALFDAKAHLVESRLVRTWLFWAAPINPSETLSTNDLVLHHQHIVATVISKTLP